MKRPRRRRSAAGPLLLASIALAAGPHLHAAARGAADPGCAPEAGDAAVVIAAVTDDLDVTLADGRVLRLAGIDPPRATTASPDLPARARGALEAWGALGPVVLHRLAPAPDRWNRSPALLVRQGSETTAPSAAADVLLQAGLARARPEPAVHGCLSGFLAAEAAARAQRLGLWADPRYGVLGPGDAAGLAAQAGGMALVEGVLHVHEGRGALYLALGRDRWGFSALVARRDALRFAKAGFDLHDYEGTPVRLRGDLDVRFGPRLRLTDPDALESLEPGSLTDAAEPAKHWTGAARHR